VGITEITRTSPRHLQHKATMVFVAALLLRTASNARCSGILTHMSTETKTFCIPLRSASDASDFRIEHALFSGATDGLSGDAMIRGSPLSWPRLAGSQRSCLPPLRWLWKGLPLHS
ncbi:Flavohemoprotein, partial [Giardia duodenalis]